VACISLCCFRDAFAAGTVAIIGPNANLSQSDSGYYGPPHPCDNAFYTLADSVVKFSDAKAQVVLGVPNVLSSDTSGIPAAVAAAAAADHVVLAVGASLLFLVVVSAVRVCFWFFC
jgi:hypothetical protein